MSDLNATAPASNDATLVTSTSAASVRTYSQAEVDALLARQREALTAFNPAPAIEEGPHLQDPELRRHKRRQLRDAGLTGTENHLTDDMRAILAEEDE